MKKFFISADLEGVCGVVAPEDIEEVGSNYQTARIWMTDELNAVIGGLCEGGADEIVVCDSHNIAQNILYDRLDPRAQLLRGTTRPDSMVHSIDSSYSGLLCTGYHAKFGTQHALLDHTYDAIKVRNISINGKSVGELGFNSYLAAERGVPLLMTSGDAALAAEAADFCPQAEAVILKWAEGRFCGRCLSMKEAHEKIRAAAKRAAENVQNIAPVEVPKDPYMEITFQQVNLADGAERVPGTKRIDAFTVGIRCRSIEEAMRARQVMTEAGAEFYSPLF